MPLIKIDYVVSFSSEDPDHPASNLLDPDVKRKWMCNKGEPSCSVVLQLKRTSKIDSITIGACHVALVEVLVGLSEKPNEPYQVLVPSCALLSPLQSRRGEPVETVRTFSSECLAQDACARRWDRVRLVCSQPYNKHCRYGLAFVDMSGPETCTISSETSGAAGALPQRLFRLDAGSSDEDDFRPGELFAKHKLNTDTQIRRASSQALNNIPDKSTKLNKAIIVRNSRQDHNRASKDVPDERRGRLSRADVDRRAGERSHQDEPDRIRSEVAAASGGKSDNKTEKDVEGDTKETQNVERIQTKKTHRACGDVDRAVVSPKKKKPSPETLAERQSEPERALAGVVFALSGYENPRRGALRAAATAMGAQYRPDWTPDCTHLVCAFPNTPKLRRIRAAGANVVAVRGEWLEQCARRRRRLSSGPFAVGARAGRDRSAHRDEDTDDEIEKVHKRRDEKKHPESPSTARGKTREKRDRSPRDDADSSRDEATTRDESRDSDVTFVCDERVRARIAVDDDSEDSGATEEDERPARIEGLCSDKELPNFFEGCTFVMESETLAASERALLARYVRAYGGLVLQELETPDGVAASPRTHYVVSAGGECGTSEGRRPGRWVRPTWLWRCHAERTLSTPRGDELV